MRVSQLTDDCDAACLTKTEAQTESGEAGEWPCATQRCSSSRSRIRSRSRSSIVGAEHGM